MIRLKKCNKCNTLRHEMYDCDCDKMSIWKDEFPCYEFEYDEFKKLEDSNIFVLFDDGKIEKATVDTYFTVEGNEHKEIYYVENICTNSFTYDGCDMVKWCYEEDLIKQAGDE